MLSAVAPFLSLLPDSLPSYLRVVLCHQATKPAHPPPHLSTPIPAGLKAVCFLFSVLYTFHVMRKLNSFRYRTMITFGPIAASPKICCHATDAAAAAVLQRERVWVVALLGLPHLPNIACDLRMLWRKFFSLPSFLSLFLSLSLSVYLFGSCHKFTKVFLYAKACSRTRCVLSSSCCC